MHTRRHFSGLLLATLVAGSRSSSGAPQSPLVGGVHLGLESYSLMPLRGDGLQDRWIELMRQLGFAECSVYEPLLQPRELATKLQAAREAKDRAAIDAAMQEMSKWRTSLSVSSFRDMRNKFGASGIRFAFFSGSTLTATSTDADLEHVCSLTQALGAEFVTVAAGKTVVKRLLPLVERYNLRIGIQGRPNAHPPDPDAIARPADFEEAVSYSPRCAIDIDIGDATGAGFEVMPFVIRNHARIVRIEMKDRKRDNTSMPWGQGETPLKDVLLYVREKGLPIRCYIDCDYAPATEERIASIVNCRAYIRSVLGA
jgi:sugar phosphate isomerase/epimerase